MRHAPFSFDFDTPIFRCFASSFIRSLLHVTLQLLQVWCVAPNDHFVMHAWGHELGAHGKLRMMGDGSQRCAAALGLLRDLSDKGLGMRCHRALLISKNGVVVHAVQEEAGKFELSGAGAALQVLSKL